MNSKNASVSYHTGMSKRSNGTPVRSIRRTDNPGVYQLQSGGQTFKIIRNNKIEPSGTIVKELVMKEIEEEHIFVLNSDGTVNESTQIKGDDDSHHVVDSADDDDDEIDYHETTHPLLIDEHINEIVDSSLLTQDVPIDDDDDHETKDIDPKIKRKVSVNAGFIEERDDINGYTIINNGRTISIKGDSDDVLVQIMKSDGKSSPDPEKSVQEEDETFECSKCNQNFDSRVDLNHHKTTIHKEIVDFQCDICHKIFLSKRNYLKHTIAKSCSPEEIPFCNFCNRRFKNQSLYEKHRRLHETPNEIESPKSANAFLCSECGKTFNLATSLQRHRKIHSDDIKLCPECGKTFCDNATLETHLRSHTGEQPYMCNQCGKRFGHASNLNKHKRIHVGLKPYRCEFCGKGFSELNYVKIHYRTHTGEKPYSCNICGRTFAATNSLASHKRTHFNETTFVCELCGKKFTENESLQSHIRTLHSTELPHTCNICGRSFSSTGHLSIHMKSHSNVKRFACGICNGKFPTPSLLKSHMTVHKKLKKTVYRCNYCNGKQFESAKLLSEHLQTHRSVANKIRYKCDHCSELFNDLYSLSQHIIVHPECDSPDIMFGNNEVIDIEKMNTEFVINDEEIIVHESTVIEDGNTYRDYEITEEEAVQGSTTSVITTSADEENVILIHPDFETSS